MIPNAAAPVLDILRRDVPKPLEIPTMTMTLSGLKRLRFKNNCCPLGLHPLSATQAPGDTSNFAGGVCEQRAVTAFWYWFEQQTDAEATIQEIWG